MRLSPRYFGAISATLIALPTHAAQLPDLGRNIVTGLLGPMEAPSETRIVQVGPALCAVLVDGSLRAWPPRADHLCHAEDMPQ